MADKPQVELAQLIRTLREELGKAVAEGEGKGIRFQLENVELELQVTVGLAGKGEGKVKVWLVEAGGEAKASRESVQRIKLTLKPDPSSWDGSLAASVEGRPK